MLVTSQIIKKLWAILRSFGPSGIGLSPCHFAICEPHGLFNFQHDQTCLWKKTKNSTASKQARSIHGPANLDAKTMRNYCSQFIKRLKAVHYVWLRILKDRKMRPLQIDIQRIRNNHKKQNWQKKLYFHYGLQSFQLTCASPSALVGWLAGTG